MRIGTHIGYKIPPLRGYKSILTLGETTLPSDITFSRGTNATLTDSNGRIAWAPHNLLTNSESFEAAAWGKASASITANAAVAPDGTTTADKLVEDATTNAHYIGVNAGTVGIQEVFSFYAKAAERAWCVAQIGNNGLAYYDLQNGVTGTVTNSTAAITPVGNGWFRCSISAVRSLNTNNLIYPATANNTVNYTGNGTSGIFIWGAQLNVANAPVNLLTWSEQFDNADWTKTALNTTGSPPWVNVAVAPDGTTTADKLIANNTSTQHFFRQNIAVAAGSYTMSVYAKAAEYSGLWMSMDGGSNYGLFTLSGAGSTSTTTGTSTITSVGNGWYLCTFTFTRAAGTAALFFGSANPAGMLTFAGNGADGIFLWGAQLNTGSVALPYVATTSSIYLPPAYNPTTPKNLLGFTQEPENAAWTKSNSYVQQNLLTWSQDFDNAAWTKSFVTVTANATVAPDGTTTAEKIVEDTNTNFHNVSQSAGTVGNTETLSFYAKAAERTWCAVQLGVNGVAYYDLQNGVLGTVTAATATITSVGNGWYRCSITAVRATSASNIIFVAQANNTGNYTGNGTSGIFLWGAQLVQGSTAGDYTQTTSAAAPTRYLNWDGTLTGRKLVEDTAGGVHVVYASTAVAAVPYTLSMYAKPAERNFARLDFVTSAYAAGSTVILNLTTGVTTVTNYGATTGTTATAVSVGGGWYRLTMTVQATAATYFSQIGLSSTNSTGSYTGDGTSGIYVSDFQLSNSASVDPYVYNPQAAAASAAFYGPRFDYNPTGTPVLSGTELVTNGTFDSNLNGWTLSQTVTASLPVWSAGAMKLVSDGTGFSIADQSITTVASTTYSFTLTNTYPGSGTFDVRVGTAQGAQDLLASQNIASGGTLTYTFVATGTTSWIRIRTGSNNATGYLVDNVSVRAITGYTATANGLLIEEQRTNLVTYSEQLNNAYWQTASGTVTVTANAVTAPDGTLTADLVIPSAASAFHRIFSPDLNQTAVAYSVFVKAGGYSKIALREGATQGSYISVNLNTGTIIEATNVGTGTVNGATITAFGNGWYRLSGYFVTPINTAWMLVVLPDSYTSGNVTNAWTGDGVSGVYVWGAQAELGSFATSYIPTVASQVTRNADSASMLGDNFYTWYNPNQGTLSAEADSYTEQIGINSYNLASINDGTTSNYIRTYLYATNGGLNVRSGNVVQANIPVGTWSRNVPFKTAGVYKLNDFQIAFNGTLGTPDTSGTIPTVSQLNIGANNGVGGFTNGHIRRISYYSTRLPDSTLQALTT